MVLTRSPVVADALRAAVRAPSPHNTQPWIFELAPDTIDIVLDEDRVLGACDPDAREARLACGAASLNLRLALAAAGRAGEVEFMPERERPALLARVTVGPRHRPTATERRLAAAIPRRYSNRRPFTDEPVPLRVRTAVREAARTEGARLVLLDEAGLLEATAGLIRRADHLQGLDAAFQQELRAWTRRTAEDDGVPAFAGGPRSAGGLLPGRYVNEDGAPRVFERDPLVAVLTMPNDASVSQIRAGCAMQRVLLTATDAGLSASFYSQPIEIAAVRAELRDLLGGAGHPQTVFRLGHGSPGVTTPRRPIEAVVRDKREVRR
ncbi:Acg family FMN-binding oxidoreductase [Amycolatopsis sp. EV170708-02-1]|uniref:Acg family FMN-binding oxidoreductase n=1 Tax=Amycolatopsis sp. EV170708-02-1 TaxID=2919322 RepID=UPI001F0C94FF|nr:nitroreductase family protein [Amycolatopsis sp. EV170708-02-1]UMP07249.1 nitroreductase family protein [Amycolatopsis sp. EV170708-02-1]